VKRLAIMGLLAFLGIILVVGTLSAQPAGPGNGGGSSCPKMGGGPGPGSPGGQGGGACPYLNPQTGSPGAKPGQPLTADQAKALVEQEFGRNPNLKTGKVVEKGGNYEVVVVTKDGSLVDKIEVDKQTGSLRSIY
jgi:hypothetical protein